MNTSAQEITRRKLFQWYVHSVWPIQRLFLRKRLARRCKNCILSEKYAGLENDLCPECRSTSTAPQSDSSTDKQAQELDALLNEYKGKGAGKYDALLMLSGGKDSALLLHQLLTEYQGLRLLTLTIDNGFFSPVAEDNIKHLVRKLDVDHMIFTPAVSLFRKTFRHALTHLGNRGCYDVVDRLDGDLLHDIGRHIAAEMRIPLLISGVSHAQVDRIFGIDSFEMPPEREHSKRTTSAEFELEKIFTPEEMHYWWNPEVYPREDISRVIFPFYAWQYEEEEIKQKVKELDLIRPGHDSPLLTNNATIPVMGIVDMCRLGYSSFEPEFAQLVRQGKAKRRTWCYMFELLEYSAKTGFLIEKEVMKTLKQLGLTKADLGLS